jgi:hypothetical protein
MVTRPPPRSPNRFAFTQVTVERVRLPKTGRVIYWDLLLPGFGLRVSTPRVGCNPHKVWVNLYRDANRKLVFETLRTCVLIPKLSDARTMARASRLAAQSSADMAQAASPEPLDGNKRMMGRRNQSSEIRRSRMTSSSPSPSNCI